MLRAIPLILLAVMFVSTVGLGPFPGVLAVAVHSTGMLGKFYAEAFENAGEGVLEAVDSSGASWLQRVRFAVLPEVAPDVARDTHHVPLRAEPARIADPGTGRGRRHRLLHPGLCARIPYERVAT